MAAGARSRPESSGKSVAAPAETLARIQSGHEALGRSALEEARTSFENALALERTPEALEGLAAAAWLAGDAETATPAFESAYGLYRKRGDGRAAARVATTLALSYEGYRGESAVASGWLQRAGRLLEGLEPGPEHAWYAVWSGHLALLYHSDPETARRWIAEARSLAAALGLNDVELLALGLEGVALVSQCRVSEGMQRLDETTAAAVGGEMTRLDAAGNLTCYLLTACEKVQDFDRAGQWYGKVRAYLEHVRMNPGLTLCRDHMIGILLWRGAWVEAEQEIDAMIRESETLSPRFVGTGLLRLASLRFRQGRLEEAADLFARVKSEALGLPGRAALALDEGDPKSAIALVDRYLRRLSPEQRLERIPGLEILARAQCARGRQAEAGTAVAEMRELAGSAPTEAMRATVRAAEGAVALAAGDFESARRSLEDAVDLFEKSGGPFDNVRARLDLALALKSLGQRAEADREASAALAIAERIGAAREAERARAFLEKRRFSSDAADAIPGLTAREIEVLGLVAGGLSNQKIARRLFLSEHTVKRHVANILGKLDLPSRAAAAALAARHGLH